MARAVWGDESEAVFANWMSQIHYIGLCDWHDAERNGCYGMVFDYYDNPVVHPGAFDDNSLHQRDPETNRLNLDMMAGVFLHELFHVAEPLHTGIDLAPIEQEYSDYYWIVQKAGLSELAFEEGEMIAWVGEMYTFGYEEVDRELWVRWYSKLVEWVEANRERILVRFLNFF